MEDTRSDARNLQEDAKAIANTARDGAGQAASEAADHARRAAGDISDTAEMTFEQLKEQVVALKADMSKLATSAGEASYEYVGGHLGDAMGTAKKFTRERPIAACGIAAGAGFILAHMLSRR